MSEEGDIFPHIHWTCFIGRILFQDITTSRYRVFYGSVHAWCRGTVPKYNTRWVLMWTQPFFKYPWHSAGYRLWDRGEGGGAVIQTLFSALRASLWSKNKWEPGPFPAWIRHCMLEFGHSAGAGARVQGLDLVLGHKSGNWVPVRTHFL